MKIQDLSFTHVGETECLDSDGTYKEFWHVHHKEGGTIDLKALEKEAYERYSYSRGPGQYFCSRVTVYRHPYSTHEAVVEAEHQMDI